MTNKIDGKQKKASLSARIPNVMKKRICNMAKKFGMSITTILYQIIINGLIPTEKQLMATKKIFIEGME